MQLRLDGLGQTVERECVRHIGAALPEQRGDLAMAVAVTLDQRRQGRRLLQRTEVLALQVLDESDLERVTIVADDRGQAVETRSPGGAEATLAGQQLVPAVVPADDDGLQKAALEDRRRQLGERLLVEVLPRLLRIRLDRRERYDRQDGAPPALDGSSDREQATRSLAFRPIRLHQHHYLL